MASISPLNNTVSSSGAYFQSLDKLEMHTSDKKAAQSQAKAAKDADGTNPNAKLNQEAFMKLLLEELRHQDPTSPMDSDKMLTQTSQLAALETQEKTNKTMDKLAQRMELLSNSIGIGMISAVGKTAYMKKDGFAHDGKNSGLEFNIYMPDFINKEDKNIEITVYDERYEPVDKFYVDGEYMNPGNNNYIWDTRYEDGTIRPKGEYKFIARYKNLDGQLIEAPTGFFRIDGVRFEDGQAYFTAGKIKVKFDDIKEFQGISIL